MRIRVGIDIGSDGAYAVFANDKLVKYGKTPATASELDMDTLSHMILQGAEMSLDEEDDFHVVIEDLHSIFGTSAKSNFIFGLNNGLVIGMLQMIQWPWSKVQAKKWQKFCWEGVRPVEINTGKLDKNGNTKYKIDTKATSLLAAKRLFPKESFLATDRSKVAHNGIVDAVLIGWYCTKHF